MRRVSVFLAAAAFFLSLGNFSPGASLDLPTLFPINQHDKWGFLDRQGRWAIPPIFDYYAQSFSQGFAGVRKGEKTGFINRTGKMVLGPFDQVESFAEGLAAVKVGERWGYIDRSGKLVWQTIIPCGRWGKPLESDIFQQNIPENGDG